MENGKANISELDNLVAGVRADRSTKILQFKAEKNKYVIGDEVVPLGTTYYVVVHGWLKFWLKFVNKVLVDRKVYHVAKGETPPLREDLGDVHLMGAKDDPWVKQYTLPLESVDTGELLIFQTSTFYGREAVWNLVNAYTKHAETAGQHQPIVELATTKGKSKKSESGYVSCPEFKIIGWDDGNASTVAENIPAAIPLTAVKRDDMDDQIPF